MTDGPFPNRISRLFWKCIGISIGVHCLFISSLYLRPLLPTTWFSLPYRLTPKITAYDDPNVLLNGVFDDLVVVTHNKNLAYDAHFPSRESNLPILESHVGVALEKLSPIFTPFSPYLVESTDGFILRNPQVSNRVISHQIPYPHPVCEATDHDLTTIKLPTLAPTSKDGERDELAIHHPLIEAIEPLASIFVDPLLSQNALPIQELYSAIIVNFDAQQQSIISSQASPLPMRVEKESEPLQAFELYGIPKFKEGREWRNLFHMDVQIMPRKEQEGMFFAVTLVPKPEAVLNSLKQHFHFIVDCSKTTEKHRISIYKRALVRALDYLQDGHTFNIYFVDKTIRVLSTSSVVVSRKTIQQAKSFIEKQVPKGLSSKENLLDLLEDISNVAKSHAKTNEINSVILLSDGVSFEESNRRRQPVKEWLKDGPPPFVLYAATIGNDSHPLILDAIALSTGGRVLHSSTHAAFPRKFAKLLIDLKAPIATEVKAKVFSDDPSAAITLMGTSCRMPPLFASQPITLFGVANGPENFTIHLQAMSDNTPITIPLDINLKSSREGALTFRQIAMQDKAEYELSKYLQDGKEAHFDLAIEWLEHASERRTYR